MPTAGQKDHLASRGGSDKREIVCHYREVSWRSRDRIAWHCPDVTGTLIWGPVASVKIAVSTEKNFAPPGPSLFCQYPLSFFRFAPLRDSARGPLFGAEHASENVAHIQAFRPG